MTSGSEGGDYEDGCLLDCSAMQASVKTSSTTISQLQNPDLKAFCVSWREFF
jgi:hypothetical protein